MRLQKFIRSILFVFLMFNGLAHALTLLPPLPAECNRADKSADFQEKVRLYTECLNVGVNFEYGVKMEKWQRTEIHFKRGNALFELQRYPEALADYNLFINQAGGHVWAFHQRGMTHEALDDDRKALEDFDAALKLNSEAIVVRYSRGALLAKTGQYVRALEDLRFAAGESPQTALFSNDLAWLLATCPEQAIRNGSEAVKYARQAVAIERNASYLDTLAAALARSGNYKEAVATQKEAIELAFRSKAEHASVKDYQDRLELYSARKPFTKKEI